ncbi:MAG: YbaK/EbsC family protein [Parachlamydiaceae bacterium]|nr:YbaK/EbsC family protein [Parachlamydiaceae bacterium]
MTILSKSAEMVQRALYEKGLKFEVVELKASTRTANDAAMTIGCQVGQIIKSLLFRTKETQRPVLVLVSGKNRVNEESIQRSVGEKIAKADADFTREITGFAIGGIPPLGHKNPISFVFIDEDLLHHETLWAAAGTPYAVFSLPAKELQKLTSGEIVSVKESS